MKKSDWDVLAQEYARRDFPASDWEYGYKPVLALLGKVHGKRILDYGCGSGKFSRILATRGAHVIAMDPNPEMLKLAQSQDIAGIDYHKIVEGTVPTNGPLDAAVINYVICGIPKDDEILTILQGINRVLHEGGPCIILNPHPHQRQRAITRQPLEILLEGMTRPVYDYSRSIEEYTQLLTLSGFSVDKILEIGERADQYHGLILRGRKCTQ